MKRLRYRVHYYSRHDVQTWPEYLWAMWTFFLCNHWGHPQIEHKFTGAHPHCARCKTYVPTWEN